MSPLHLAEMILLVAKDLNEATDKSNDECVQPLRDAGIVPDMHVGGPAQDVQFLKGEVLQVMKLEWFAGQLLAVLDSNAPPDIIAMWIDQAEYIIADVLR